MTSPAEATQAVYEAFRLALGTRLPYTTENADLDAALGWCRIRLIETISFQETLGKPGNRSVEHHGTIAIEIFLPLNGGTRPHADLWAVLVPALEMKNLSGVYTSAASAPRNAGRIGRWYKMEVSVPFVYYRRA